MRSIERFVRNVVVERPRLVAAMAAAIVAGSTLAWQAETAGRAAGLVVAVATLAALAAPLLVGLCDVKTWRTWNKKVLRPRIDGKNVAVDVVLMPLVPMGLLVIAWSRGAAALVQKTAQAIRERKEEGR